MTWDDTGWYKGSVEPRRRRADPSLELKHRVIAQKYRDRIEKMYAQPMAESG